MTTNSPQKGKRIDWHRVRDIFDHPKPPFKIWERQFDYFDDELKKLAQTPYEQIEFGDLWYYHHDLAYVELQPEVFNYLFPVCLMDWHLTLMANESCSHGDSEFHYGLVQGDVLEKMLTAKQCSQVGELFVDSMLVRLDSETELRMSGSRASAHGWISRLNSLGLVMPVIPTVWAEWWKLDTTGRSISAIQYLSGLMYFEGENPVFDMWTPEHGGGGPYLWANDSYIYDRGWIEENVKFLASVLNYDFVSLHLQQAVIKLADHRDVAVAEHVLNDLEDRKDIIEARSAELPSLLRKKKTNGWTV